VRHMSKPSRGTINVDDCDSVPDRGPSLQHFSPPAAPNVLLIVPDDVGFAAMEPARMPVAMKKRE
jgi:hypothetical protein